MNGGDPSFGMLKGWFTESPPPLHFLFALLGRFTEDLLVLGFALIFLSM